MFRICKWQVCVALLGVLGYCDLGRAQSYSPQQPYRGQEGVPAIEMLKRYQQRSQASTQNSTSSRSAARIGLGTNSSLRSKPFSSYQPAPTVSPYLNLFRDDFSGQRDFNYSTLVKPALQQQQLNQQLQRQNLELSRRVQAIAAQNDYNPQGAKDQYPTGHQTVFMYYGHYFPQVRQQK